MCVCECLKEQFLKKLDMWVIAHEVVIEWSKSTEKVPKQITDTENFIRKFSSLFKRGRKRKKVKSACSCKLCSKEEILTGAV